MTKTTLIILILKILFHNIIFLIVMQHLIYHKLPITRGLQVVFSQSLELAKFFAKIWILSECLYLQNFLIDIALFGRYDIAVCSCDI